MKAMKSKRPLRSGQIIMPYGIGQLVNFPDGESLIIAGLDAWEETLKRKDLQSRFKIEEPRLSRALGVKHFRQPFPFKNSGEEKDVTVPAYRFPRWHYCPRCFRMKFCELDQPEIPVCNCKSLKYPPKMLQVWFVAACHHGHIQDFPFFEFVHSDEEESQCLKVESNLLYKELSGPNTSSILIECTNCGKTKYLAGIMGIGALDRVIGGCYGSRPWLGPAADQKNQAKCGESLHVLIRGSSNLHFPVVQSALSLPSKDETIKPRYKEVIDKSFDKLEKARIMGGEALFNMIQLIVDIDPVLNEADESELLKYYLEGYENEAASLNKLNQGGRDATLELRRQEYTMLSQGRRTENADFKAIPLNLDDYNTELEADERKKLELWFSSIVLVERLKETRAYTGFTRVDPAQGKSPDGMRSDLRLEGNVDWLPAHEVYGEGIFFRFRDESLDKWNNYVKDRLKQPLVNYLGQGRRHDAAPADEADSAVFLLLHTFAHLLINRLCYNSGYGSSSLRERLYFHPANDKKSSRMNGVLVYTSSGDSEGSLGGLVRQGKPPFLMAMLHDAIEDASWCSADPVCMDVGSGSGQGPHSANGAACHNCTLVPETSCEIQNMLLDRRAIIGVEDEDSDFLGFFQFE